MSSKKMRFDEFLSLQKKSVRRLNVVVLLSRFDKTRGPVFVMDAKGSGVYLNKLVFDKAMP